MTALEPVRPQTQARKEQEQDQEQDLLNSIEYNLFQTNEGKDNRFKTGI